jgi:hypothetical protein
VAIVNDEVEVLPVELDNGQLKKEFLSSDSAFILDCDTQIFVWIGKKCDIVKKKSAAVFAEVRTQCLCLIGLGINWHL